MATRVGTWGWTKDKQIFIPDVRFTSDKEGRTYEALRGIGYGLAVFEGGECIGYIQTEDLGFESAKAWAAAQTIGGEHRHEWKYRSDDGQSCPRCGSKLRPCSTGEADDHCDICGAVIPWPANKEG